MHTDATTPGWWRTRKAGASRAIPHWTTAAVFIAIYTLLASIDHEPSKRRQSRTIAWFDLLIARVSFLSGVYRVSKKVIELFRGRGQNGAQKRAWMPSATLVFGTLPTLTFSDRFECCTPPYSLI